MLDRAEQHAAGATGRVVDALTLLRIEQLDHHPHHTARRIELARLLAPRDVGELADQVLVGVAEDVGSDRRVAQRHTGQAFDEVLEQLVAEHLAVAPVGRAEDARQRVGVGPFDRSHRPRQRGADVRGCLADVPPVATVRQREAMQLRKDAQVDVAVFLSRLGHLLVPDVADPLEEQQREDVTLPVRPVDGAATQDLSAVPEAGLQILESQWSRGHRRPQILSVAPVRRRSASAAYPSWEDESPAATPSGGGVGLTRTAAAASDPNSGWPLPVAAATTGAATREPVRRARRLTFIDSLHPATGVTNRAVSAVIGGRCLDHNLERR